MITQRVASYSSGRLGWLREIAVTLVAAYVLGISANFRVTVPFSPVPVTAQTLVVLLIGAGLSRRQALASVSAYLIAGAAGLPLFAAGTLWGPTGGYLLGFLGAVWVIASLMESGWVRHPAGSLLALTIGNLAIYVVGLPWLALFVGVSSALPMGLYPFLLGDTLKLLCVATIVSVRAWRDCQDTPTTTC
ncbi:MAG: biotin transporter BioY [Anaerolineae bacterium]